MERITEVEAIYQTRLSGAEAPRWRDRGANLVGALRGRRPKGGNGLWQRLTAISCCWSAVEADGQESVGRPASVRGRSGVSRAERSRNV